MLVLSRKQQEQIKIGDQITVTIVRVKGNTVRVGIEAPRDVRVIRGELPKLDAEAVQTADIEEQSVAASNDTPYSSHSLPNGSILSFRVLCESDAEMSDNDETQNVPSTTRSAAHLPLKRINDRFGDAPLKQLLASCATLAK